MRENGYVYIIELDRPIGNSKKSARFYVGCTYDLLRRFSEHKSGQGSAMLRYCNQAGIGYKIVHVEKGYRERELVIKGKKNAAKYLASRPKQTRPYGLHNWYTKLFGYLACCDEVEISGNCVYWHGIKAFFTKRAMIAIHRNIRAGASGKVVADKRERMLASLNLS